MNQIITTSIVDEFNYTHIGNWMMGLYGEGEYSIVCFKNHEILFPKFDSIISINNNVQLNLSIDGMFENGGILESEAKKYPQKFIYPQEIIDGVLKKYSTHVYKFVFSQLTREMQSGEIIFKPKEKDYIQAKDFLSRFNGKIVTINGRNTIDSKNHGRNNSLDSVILELLKNDITVINCTIPSYNIDIIDEKYIDVSDECIDYSKNISYFLNSDALITIGDAGGVTNHISTASNVIIYGKGGWVDNAEFGNDGESLFHAKKRIHGNAFQVNSTSEIIEILVNIKRPIINDFFNEGKIINHQ